MTQRSQKSSNLPPAEFFGWKRHPFIDAGNKPDDIFLTSKEQDILELAQSFLRLVKSFAVIGPPGSGKTTFVKNLLHQLDSRTYHVASLPYSGFERKGLLRLLADIIGLDLGKRGLPTLARIYRHILSNKQDPTAPIPLIVLDDAQLMEQDSLMDLCSLLAHPEQNHAVASIILIGDESLEKKMRLSTMRAVYTRMACIFRLDPVTEQEAKQLLIKQLEVVSGPRDLFDHDAIEIITSRCGGNKRELMNIATALCIEAHHRKEKVITSNLVLTSSLYSQRQ
ncbi:MAG: ExeA family protein [Terrimicrobiaceae bacterium]